MKGDKYMKVVEKFVSIQGEGPFAGVPSSFIRFQGCVLACSFCDSKYSWYGVSEADDMSLESLQDFVSRGPKHVVLTGGEPLLQLGENDFKLFISYLLANDYTVSFETTMLRAKSDAIYGRIGSNYAKVQQILEADISKINFIVSPKFDLKCYGRNKPPKIEMVLNFYVGAPYKNLFFKPIYTPEIEPLILEHLSTLNKNWIKTNMFIMPYTPIPFDYEEYISSCSATAMFCVKNNLRYSPRIQIDIWGNTRGV